MTPHKPTGDESARVIPKWADDKAGEVLTIFSRGDNAYIDRALLHGAFAAALVQERERCAKIVEDYRSGDEPDDPQEAIISAIRGGE